MQNSTFISNPSSYILQSFKKEKNVPLLDMAPKKTSNQSESHQEKEDLINQTQPICKKMSLKEKIKSSSFIKIFR